MDKVRLNHFILWCKNWYEPIDTKVDLFKQAQTILVLDGYNSFCEPVSVSLNYIDDLVKDGTIKPIRLMEWNAEIVNTMCSRNVDYYEALLYRIRNFFAFECTKLPLVPPIYSRKIYKLGFIAPTYFGNSYKLANYKANKFFNKK